MGKSLISYITPKNLGILDKFRSRIEGSPTMMGLVKKLDGVNGQEAYTVIDSLSVKEKKVLATLIGEINAEIKK